MKRYEEIPHTADLAATIYGKDLPGLFENAAFAMFDMMADLSGVMPEETVRIDIEEQDTESLLISWLNEVLYAGYIKHLVFSEFRVTSLGGNRLSAEAMGMALDPRRIKNEIKAATYHDLKIEKRDGDYEVTIVFDV